MIVRFSHPFCIARSISAVSLEITIYVAEQLGVLSNSGDLSPYQALPWTWTYDASFVFAYFVS